MLHLLCVILRNLTNVPLVSCINGLILSVQLLLWILLTSRCWLGRVSLCGFHVLSIHYSWQLSLQFASLFSMRLLNRISPCICNKLWADVISCYLYSYDQYLILLLCNTYFASIYSIMNSFRYHSNRLTGVIIIDVRSVRASLRNRGTIVVLNRYASALCFLEVFWMVVL